MSNPTMIDANVNTASETKVDLAREQISQAMETFRELSSLLIQIVVALITADIAVVGFAFSSKSAGILLVGAVIPFVLILTINAMGRRMKPIVFSAVCLESKYGGNDDPWLATTFLSTVISQEYVKKLQDISKSDNASERVVQLRKMPSPLTRSRAVEMLLIPTIFAQIITSIVLVANFNWQLF